MVAHSGGSVVAPPADSDESVQPELLEGNRSHMPPVIDLNLVPLVGDYTYIDGTYPTGTVTVTYSKSLRHRRTHKRILGKSIVIQLTENQAGQFSVEVPATDDPDLEPNTGVVAEIRENFSDGGGRPPFSIKIPYGASQVHLGTVLPVGPGTDIPTASTVESRIDRAGAEAGWVVSLHPNLETLILTPAPAGTGTTDLTNYYTKTEVDDKLLTATQGVPGKSAYEVAVDNGFVGTLQKWLDSLVGPSGPAPSFPIVTQATYDALPSADKLDPTKLYLIRG